MFSLGRRLLSRRARVWWRSVVSEGFLAHGRFLYGQAEVGGVFFRSVFSKSKETVVLRKEKKRETVVEPVAAPFYI
jgi:hypothetical protein